MLFSNQSLKPCLIVLTTKPSASSFKIIDKGVKISQLIKIKKFLNIQNIEWEFATLGGKKCLINSEGDESNKDWIKDHQEKLANPLNLEKVEARNFSGILFLNLFGYYTEFYPVFKRPNNSFQASSSDTPKPKDLFRENASQVIENLLKDFYTTNKPIATLGYGVLMLFHAFEKSGWVFSKLNMTGISINEECREVYFTNLPFLIEESVRELDGNFIAQNNPNQSFVIVDKILISGQNDNSLLLVLNSFAFLITKPFLYNL